MRFITLLSTLLIICSFSTTLKAQSNYEVSGQLQDTLEHMFLEYTSVALIQAEDSILSSYTRSDLEGNFKMNVDKPGDYIIIVSHPSFATYLDKITIKDPATNLGEIFIISKRNLLEGVIISAQRAIMIKGDTIEYAADSFNVREFANVDELLKKLPGLEVNRDGSITAHGEKVQKMYVDGEEFFSDDPAVLAKTLKASSIDKVQVFNDKSENAKNTGIDDGETVKTINLTLKEDAKKGTMGRVGAGYAINDYYEGELVLQNFKGKRKLALFALGGNTNNTQLSWQDRMSMGENFEMNEDGGMIIDNTSFGDFTGGDNNGLPRSLNGGLHFSDKFLNDKLKFNANYSLNSKNVDQLENGTTTNNVPGAQYFTKSNSTSHSENLSNSLTIRTEYAIDSLTTIILNANGALTNKITNSETNTEANDENGNSINNSSRINHNTTNGQSARLSLTYRKKFKKEGRSFSANINGSLRFTENNGTLNSNNYIKFNNTNISYDQNKYNTSETNQYGFRVTYSEPLIKKTYLELNYGFTHNSNLSDNRTFDVNNGTEVYNPLFSNHYKFDYNSHRGGAALRFADKKIKSSIGLDLSNINFEQENYTNALLSRSYSNFNLFPRATFNYKINTYSSVNFRYNGNTNQPTINQIQPIIVNTDPTNIMIGNDQLRQEFNHSMSLQYNTYSMLKGQYIYAGINSNIRQNPFAQSQTIDASGFKVYQYVNTRTSQNYSLWGGFNQKIIENLKFNLGGSASYNKNYNIINGLENLNNAFTLSPSLGINYEKDTLLMISYSFNPTYNTSTSSIRTDITNNYWSYSHRFDISYELPLGISIGTDVDWNIRPRLSENVDGMNVFLWNAYVSKRLLKDRSLLAKVYCYDIMNQNVGYNYYQAGDLISERSFNIIRQYFMFSLTWNFNTMGAVKEGSGGGRRRFR